MMKICKVILFVVFIFLIIIPLKAQNNDVAKSYVIAALSNLQINDSSSKVSDLYLHIDKNVYVSNENICFSAYLLNYLKTEDSHTLHVVLINEMSQKPELEQKFVLEKGLTSGALLIPGSVPTGKYSIIAYTNNFTSGQDNRFFRESIQIFGASDSPLKISFSSSKFGDSLQIKGHLMDNNVIFKNGILEYKMFSDGVLFKQEKLNVNSPKDINFTIGLPQDIHSLEIIGNLFNTRDSISFKLPILHENKNSQLLFFPEDEKIINNLNTTIYFQLKDYLGKAISTNVVVKENGQKITTSSTDIYGMGKFNFTPNIEKKYSINIRNDSILPLQQFPTIFRNSTWQIETGAVVLDTLNLKLKSNENSNDCVLVIHNNRQIFYASYIQLLKNNGAISIPVIGWTKGLVHVSVFNKKGSISCQKTVFIKEDDPTIASIETDLKVYKPMSKVNVKIQLKKNDGSPVNGIFSFAAVPTRVLDNNSLNIVRFYNFDRFLNQNAIIPSLEYIRNSNHTAATLAFLQSKNKLLETENKFNFDTNKMYDGHVLYNEKSLKKPVSLLLLGSKSQILLTDSKGNFSLPYKQLQGKVGSKILLSVAKNPFGYKIEMQNSLKSLNTFLGKKYFISSNFLKDDLSNEEKKAFISKNNFALQEVIISSKRKELKGFYGKQNSRGHCDDYVCRLGFLNCLAHPKGDIGTIEAIDGYTYLIDGDLGTTKVVYHCELKGSLPYIKEIDATVFAESKSPFDSTDQILREELNHTTLYWQSYIKTNEKGEANLDFYTGNRTGQFTGVVQGIDEKGVFSAEINFSVSIN